MIREPVLTWHRHTTSNINKYPKTAKFKSIFLLKLEKHFDNKHLLQKDINSAYTHDIIVSNRLAESEPICSYA